ncbi:DUF11 domain-containing protein [Anabaena sp. UHCC 0204]|uniref:DUF11 domain-containing protein n=1 Tax=Anabaena sp. UHCC 0204 TaxID=2590009 RepID=UPI001445FEB1|nr:DUF11 domain-containing protein [Anabaena sp. UHCC 0204]MTJ09230.1 DUF11 domain-containing protein [Anabaena sp. UHCC 0204]
MKRFSFASLGAVALIAGLPFITQVSVLKLIKSNNIAVAQTPQKQKPVQVQLQGEKQVITKDAQGKEKITWEALTGKVKPGDVVRYTVVAENKSDRPLKNLALNGPIPKGTVLVLQSIKAPGAAQITYSIDGGRSFVTNPTITVKLPNGKTETKPAPVSAYTNIRVQVLAISPKSTVKTSYETQVR